MIAGFSHLLKDVPERAGLMMPDLVFHIGHDTGEMALCERDDAILGLPAETAIEQGTQGLGTPPLDPSNSRRDRLRWRNGHGEVDVIFDSADSINDDPILPRPVRQYPMYFLPLLGNN